MFVFQIIKMLLSVFQLILLARVLITWFPDIDRTNPLIQFLYDATEPVLRPVREMMPPSGFGGMDFSPIIVFVIIYVLQMLLPG